MKGKFNFELNNVKVREDVTIDKCVISLDVEMPAEAYIKMVGMYGSLIDTIKAAVEKE